ncbi:hypothetical protein SAMN05444365_104439 [Micromonospora pattaloongensis]|uniref:YbaB/EbfC DNA-binding family protein n=1 Tax=Micromonospora pattaloongensis TaxID=405436 RepID=A0A1H3PCL6_9ACTN|nr:hypothetical protein [Micromonospora pattaloongensis]SDY98545.1 hypothetical protein SAMN05444365_104439 [Micromonospora pattaloongensis]
MTADILSSLQQFQQYAVGMQNLLAQAQAGVPERVEATDRSGMVRAVLGRDGLPESITVEPDWQHRLTADGFGAAVLEACQTAAGERMAAWSQALQADGLRARVDRMREDLAERPAPAPADALPAELRHQWDRARPRGLEYLVEDVLRAADRVDEFAAASPLAVSGTGTDASGRLVVTVSKAGLVSCEAEPRWAGQQRGTALTAALREAVAMARADLARASQPSHSTGELDQLLTEALAILNDPQRLAQS